jgi:DNA repair exonuclease SbcCD ATPase subunit
VEIKFETLTLKNYKSHRDLEVKFGDLTKISADNAKGKSTVVECPCWLFYGTDAFGGKIDPTPITYAADETLVQLLLMVDEKPVLLGRGLKKGKAQYYINEVPSKAKEFDELRDQLFDKDLFMSLLNPSYFPSLHWEKQRELLLRYVTAPANKEVSKRLPEAQSDVLAQHLKKHSLEDLEKIHKDNKNKKDKEYIAVQSRTRTLQEQLEQLPNANVPIDSLKAELAQIDRKVRELENELDSAFEKNKEFNNLQARIRNIQDQIDMSKERWPSLKNEMIEDTCRTCKRPLDAESVEAVKADKEQRIDQYRLNHSALVTHRNQLKEQLAGLEYIGGTEIREQIKELDEKGQPLRVSIQSYSQFERLQEQVNEAKEKEKEVLQSLNESIFILDSIKAFRAKEAEMQGEKVQALFDTLSVRLFNEQKNGELKPTFEIEMDTKPYSKLSLSEGIKAGLEVRDVLSQQSDLVVPCFVDNAESITKFKQPKGQLIISRVIDGQELKIESEVAE